MVTCKCLFLDGSHVIITFKRDAKGSDLFARVCEYLNLKNRELFGLVHRATNEPSPYNWWVRLDKTVKDQTSEKVQVMEFAFIVKHYPVSTKGLQEDVARFHVCQQIRQDLLTGRLVCPVQTLALLCSYWLQSEYGDFTSRHVDLQLADGFRYVQKGDAELLEEESKSDINFEEQMIQIHKTLRGMSALEADYRFIKLASSLETYGIHYYPAYDVQPATAESPRSQSPLKSNKQDGSTMRRQRLMLGVGPRGVHQCKRNSNEIVFTWRTMKAVRFKKNRVILNLHGALRRSASVDLGDSSQADDARRREIIKEFYFENLQQTKIAWQTIIENHAYFGAANRGRLQGDQAAGIQIKRNLLGEKRARSALTSVSSNISSSSMPDIRFGRQSSRKKSGSVDHTKTPPTSQKRKSLERADTSTDGKQQPPKPDKPSTLPRSASPVHSSMQQRPRPQQSRALRLSSENTSISGEQYFEALPDDISENGLDDVLQLQPASPNRAANERTFSYLDRSVFNKSEYKSKDAPTVEQFQAKRGKGKKSSTKPTPTPRSGRSGVEEESLQTPRESEGGSKFSNLIVIPAAALVMPSVHVSFSEGPPAADKYDPESEV